MGGGGAKPKYSCEALTAPDQTLAPKEIEVLLGRTYAGYGRGEEGPTRMHITETARRPCTRGVATQKSDHV